MLVLTLPYPPSVNSIWRRVGAKTILSADGRVYRAALLAEAARQVGAPKLSGRLSVHIHAHPPDNRRRDLDNLPKAILDGMTHAGVWLDDSQIDDLRVTRCNVFPGGAIRVIVVDA